MSFNFSDDCDGRILLYAVELEDNVCSHIGSLILGLIFTDHPAHVSQARHRIDNAKQSQVVYLSTSPTLYRLLCCRNDVRFRSKLSKQFLPCDILLQRWMFHALLHLAICPEVKIVLHRLELI